MTAVGAGRAGPGPPSETQPGAARAGRGPLSEAQPGAADAYRAALPSQLWEFPLDPMDRTGVPVHAVAAVDARGRHHHGVGYGADALTARTSALGEALEELACADAVPRLPVRWGTWPQLRGEGAIDPLELIVPAGTLDAHERRLAWTPARRVVSPSATGAWSPVQGLLPLEWVAHSAEQLPSGYRPLIVPITNGLGAGDTLERALVHGLLELLQRDGNSVAYRAMDRGIAVDADGATNHLRALGIDAIVKAADCDRGIAVVHVVGGEPGTGAPHPLSLTACGEAADPDPDRAVAKALLEFCSSRVRKPFSHGPLSALARVAPPAYLDWVRAWRPEGEEERAVAATLAWLKLSGDELRRLIADPVLRARRRIPLGDLPVVDRSPQMPDRLRAVLDLLARQGLTAWWVDLSPPGGEAHVVRVVVPGLEVETMSYGRIGPRNLDRLQARGVGWAGWGQPPAGTLAVEMSAERRGWLDPGGLNRAVGDLYALYREPSRHAIPLLYPDS